jgi:hypothetical protein
LALGHDGFSNLSNYSFAGFNEKTAVKRKRLLLSPRRKLVGLLPQSDNAFPAKVQAEIRFSADSRDTLFCAVLPGFYQTDARPYSAATKS